MKPFLSFAVLALFSTAHAATVTIPNVHQLNESPGVVYRGAQPAGKVAELSSLGITDILIFKSDVKGEVAREIDAAQEAGIKVQQIPMDWKGIVDETAACKMTVKALQIVLKTANTSGRAIYFHCTVGEDRTGMLAGLYRMADQGWSAQRAYKNEMCKYGFADGNPKKPAKVANEVRRNLLPVFAKLANAIEEGRRVTPAICDEDGAPTVASFPACAE